MPSSPRTRHSGRPSFIPYQDYHTLRQQCVHAKNKFVDVAFPPENSSLFLDPDRSSEIVWKRPGELVSDPKLFVEGASPNDVTQGILGNCWFVSACSALTHNTSLLEKVIPDGQEWEPGNPYCGIFRFRFWRFGEWIEIVIDDLLPTKDGKLLFARSKTPNEFWSALLEKAFAKLYGCYENLVGGQLSDALQDVSGGVAETISVKKFLGDDTRDKDERLFGAIRTAFDNQALIVAAIAAKHKTDIEKSLRCGLVKGHAYAVTMVRYIELDHTKRSTLGTLFGKNDDDKIAMIRLQNPWGEKEWNGPWSDNDTRWEQVDDALKKELGITVDEDGEFWMPWEEFVKYFTDVSVCQLFNTGCSMGTEKFIEYYFFGEWTSNGVKCGAPQDRAGGCINFKATFCFNPQYRFDLHEDSNELMIALTQKEVQAEAAKQREPYVTIGLHVMKVETNRKYRIHQDINPTGTSDYAAVRSVYLHLRNVPPGRYILMPTTYAPREQADFLLRIYSQHECNPKLLLQDAPVAGLFSCKKATNVTRITILDATLHHPPPEGELLVCVVAEKERVNTRRQPTEGTVTWNAPFVFHKNKTRQKFQFEIWHTKGKKTIPIGRCKMTAVVDNDTRTQVLDVQAEGVPKQANLAKTRLGTLRIEISSYDDPMYL
uniref:Calpain catalytic domain-containing protein n=1 Tax=Panagrellus redivivus TaxID=6233 RepID=A0A7E4VK90_PANRE